jgi:hypothetical protein
MNDEQRVRVVIKTEEELIAIYKDAYIKLLEKLDYNTLRNMDNRHLQALLSDVRSILKSLSSDTRKWVDGNVPDLYNVGVDVSKERMSEIGIGGSFAKINRSAIEILSEDMFNELASGMSNVSRQIQTDIRKIAFQSLQKRLMFGQSASITSQEMFEDMKKNGLTALKDRAGKRWNLLTYSTMVVRTKTREIVTRGTINTMLAAGDKYKDQLLFDLVQVSSHVGSCEICLPYQGKVYSLTGNHNGYNKIPRITPFHPNCRHVLTPFFEKLYDGNIEELRSISKSEVNINVSSPV